MAPRRPINRQTIFDSLRTPDSNIYCDVQSLTNEASVESFMAGRLLSDLDYQDSNIRPKTAISEVMVPKGARKVRYRPDYIMVYRGYPRWVMDAKAPTEVLEDWEEQAAGYCLYLNQRSETMNPVTHYVLTNGLRTLVYEWDRLPHVLELTFQDFQVGNPRYERLRSLLSLSAVSRAEQSRREAQADLFMISRPTPEEARRVFAQAHKTIWQAEVINPTAAFTEFAKVMFVKLWADRMLRADPGTNRALSATGKADVPRSMVTFSTHWIQSNRQASNPVNDVLFAQLLTQLEREIVAGRKKRIFDRGESINLRPGTIMRVVERLQHYDMFGIDEDLNGRLFETFLSATMRGRELGQFFTPRSIVKIMVGLARLRVTSGQPDRVIDACCGTGGFLIEALTEMRNQVRNNNSLTDTEKEVQIGQIANHCIYGIDFGKTPSLARIARMNMYLHGDGGSKIYFADALDKAVSPTEGEDAEVLTEQEELRRELDGGLLFDVALTNPPFSMTKVASKPEDLAILSQYEMARRGSSAVLRPSLRSSVMFIERYCDVLRPGKHLITVLDDTVLASAKFGFFRDFVRKHFIIRAIISLPGDAFRRQGSRVKTSVLVLRKKVREDEAQPNAFGAFALEVGVDDLTQRASEDQVREARARAENEIRTIQDQYAQFLDGRTAGLVIPPEQLSDRFDLKHCVGDRGRLVGDWTSRGISVKTLGQLVEDGTLSVVTDIVDPQGFPSESFKLLSVTYGGDCELDATRMGSQIKAESMYQVRSQDIIVSKIRVTDGAVGVVPETLSGGLVSCTSYVVLRPANPTDGLYLWSIIRSHEIRGDLSAVSTGTNRYVTYWEGATEIQIPWLSDSERESVANIVRRRWELKAALERNADDLKTRVSELGVESPESIARFKASKAPQ